MGMSDRPAGLPRASRQENSNLRGPEDYTQDCGVRTKRPMSIAGLFPYVN